MYNEMEHFWRKMIVADPDNIRLHPYPSEALCLLAVLESGYALQYIQDQTVAICLAAVQESGMALKYVHHQA